ncbi:MULTISPECIES: hypothetical protein [unclassified Salinibacterium]|uniref:hypothetical protein n=1 Tax=unclassified Salinibacterium TaxID=2632331 RepID=UPI0018CE5F83|nr:MULTISPECIES: hypothetical protein [unclassified Salinibacterium]MBH0053502.1 hypothetical protein [Salinibacterium sp. SWN139]MBH0082770.1 hypothetical protein [Salinibacterium sp. SWN167]
MKRLIVGTLIAFGVGALVLAAITILSSLARSHDITWWSVNGVTPMWPLSVGFGALWLMALSFAFLVLLSIVGLVKDFMITRRARLEGEPV